MADRIQKFAVKTLVLIAGHLADSLYRFVEELPENAREVRGVISTLFEIKTFLHEFDGQSQDPRFGRMGQQLLDDIVLGIGGCSSTLKDLDGIVLRCNSSRRSSSPRSARKCWNEILSSFRNVEGYPIQARLDSHRNFLFSLVNLLRSTYAVGRSGSKRPETKADAGRLREQIRLLASQQEKVSSRMRELEENHRRAMEEQAYHSRYAQAQTYLPSALPTPPLYDSPPQRPYSTPLPSPYQVPPGQHSPYHRFMPNIMTHDRPITPVSPISPISPLAPPMAPRRYSNTAPSPHSPQAARTATPPTPPMRPKTRQSNHAPTQAHSAQKGTGQWWSDVFGMSPGSTSLSEPPRQGSQCYGMPMDTLNMAPEEHEIFRVEFDNDLMLRMFRNETTEAAKVVCTVGGGGGSWNNGRRNGYRFQTFIDASFLTISRVGSGIHLMRRGIMWACLYFADYETLTLFYHAFLALRYQAPNAPVPKESEYWLDGERLMFSAKIDDDGYSHALRLLKDRDSGSIRLAAARVDGDYDVTVWTAFITNQITSADWMYYVHPNTVMVKNIRQFSFSSCFETNRWRDFELKFRISRDAQDFTNVINNEFKKMTAERDTGYRRSPQTAVNRNSYF